MMNGVSNRHSRDAKVLVIDDDDALRESLTEYLKTFGFNIDSAASPSEAKQLLERGKYQVIITDIYFGPDVMTGDEFLLQNEKLIKGAKIVAITGFALGDIKRVADLETRGIRIFQKGAGILQDLRQVIVETLARDGAQKSSEQELIAIALFDNTIKLVSLTPDGNYYFLDEEQNLHKIVYVVSSETSALQRAIEELESLINNPKSKENEFQDFFERNPDFILNDDYKAAHPHLVLTKDDGGALIPDFVLEPIDQNALCDLLELKLPSAQVFVLKKSRKRFSSAVLEACAQLREYNIFFDEAKNREAIKERYGLFSYKPKMFVIIGRRGTVNPIDARNIQGDIPNLHLRNYDDIVNRMKARLDAMKKGKFRG
jgi:CheY-like chemotaxis protein